MKRNLFILLATLLLPISNSVAQDTIYTKKGDILIGQVLEVGISNVKYKKFDFQDGPTYTVSKNELFMIRYKNGSKDIFLQENKSETEDYANSNPLENKRKVNSALTENPISIDGYHYSIGYLNLNPKKTDELLMQRNNMQINLMLKSAQSDKRISKLLAFAPIPFGCAAYLTLIAGSVSGNRYSNTGIPENYLAVSGLFSLAALASGVTSIVLNVRSKGMRREAVELYNLTYFGSKN